MLLTPTATPSVHLTYPPSSLFAFPPAPLPQTLVPPISDQTLARPFNIDPGTYNRLLRVEIPIAFALIYAVTTVFINRINAQRGNKPWAFSKSTTFFVFVVVHNITLAIYSTWTFVGMLNAVRQSWPGWNGEYGLAGAADAMCKINGPRGLGNAATYNSSTSTWGFTNQAVKLLGTSPDNADVGRIWNEGLAFYGWLFYLSKFYEVMDTMIILAKGKKSTILQTYHHAGAMMCMWAGIRYMASPIWMFVIVNSAIHAFMYIYYTFSTFGFNVPGVLKQTITSLQIVQFVWGTIFAFSHLFIAYDIPVNAPYLFTHNLSTALPALASSATSAAASLTSAVASATVSAAASDWLKKIALRAAGVEGLAENVRNYQGEVFGIDAIKAAEVEKAHQEVRYRLENHRIDCVDTSGQTFAILLNLAYLAPLTWLFVNFFIRSYLHRTSSSTAHPTQYHKIQKSSADARKGVDRKNREAMASNEDLETEVPAHLRQTVDDLKADVHIAAEKLEAFLNNIRKEGAKLANDTAEEVKVKAKRWWHDAEDEAKDVKQKVDKTTEEVKSEAPKVVENVKREAKNNAENLKDKADGLFQKGKKETEEAGKKFSEKAEEEKEKTEKVATETKGKVEDKAGKTKEKIEVAEGKEEKAATRGPQPDAAKETNDKKDPADNGRLIDIDDDDQAAKDVQDDEASAGKDRPHDVDEKNATDLEASAYEVNIDEVKDSQEKEAEAKLLPNGA